MIWLIGQIWPLLLASALAGATVVAFWGQRRVATQAWEDVPIAAEPEPDEPLEGAEEDHGGSLGTSVAVDADDPDSPFPLAPGQTPTWEAEELWSRPVQREAAGDRTTRPRQRGRTSEPDLPADEWDEAAQHWRTWAAGATGRGYDAEAATESGNRLDPTDRDLFAADRGASGDSPSGGGEASFAAPGAENDDFPYARPVEASEPVGETMDPMNPVEREDDAMDDDEREAAEIRRMRLQARRGDAE